jgi:ribosomal protein S18 acetylase RimI-like enzyme
VTQIAQAAVGEGTLPPGWQEGRIEEQLESAGELLVALRFGQVVGFLALEDAGQDAVISAVAVLPTFRGRGVGTALLQAARSRLIEEGRGLSARAPDEYVARFLERSEIAVFGEKVSG